MGRGKRQAACEVEEKLEGVIPTVADFCLNLKKNYIIMAKININEAVGPSPSADDNRS